MLSAPVVDLDEASSPPLTGREEEAQRERARFRSLRDGASPAEREALIEDNLWIAKHAARRFAGRGESADDLLQVASLGLVKAVDRFDPDREVRFVTFAMPTIVGELRRHFRDRTWSVRVTRRLQDLRLELRSANERLTHELSRQPSVAEMAEDLGVRVDDVLEAIEAGLSYTSARLDHPISDGDHETYGDRLPGLQDEGLAGTPERLAVRRALQGLRGRDRRAVYLRFYLGLTQAEIAEQLGVSQVHVSRILRSSLAQMGSHLGEQDLEAG